MSIMGRVLLAGLGAGLVGVCASWLFTGVVFHPFQARTPNTWRRVEGPTQYAAASGLTLLAAVAVSALVALTGGVHVAHVAHGGGVMSGAVLGALCWTALAVPVLLSVSVFVNVHRGVVAGLLAEWLVTSVAAGAAAGWLLAR